MPSKLSAAAQFNGPTAVLITNWLRSRWRHIELILSLEELHESAEAYHLHDIRCQMAENSIVAIGTGMLVDIKQDTQPATGDIVQFLAFEGYIAIGTLEYWCEAGFCLFTGSIVEVAVELYYESVFLFVERND